MAARPTTYAQKLRNRITTFLATIPEAERADVLAEVTEAAIDNPDAMLTEAQEKNTKATERAARKEALGPLARKNPVTKIAKAAKSLQPEDVSTLGEDEFRELVRLLTPVLSRLLKTEGLGGKDIQASEALNPVA